MHFRGLESKCGNVKPSYLIEIHSEIGTLFHILVHHAPNTGEIVMKSAVYIVYNICKRMEGTRGRYLDYFVHFRGLESKRGNVKPSYLIEIPSEIGTLFHILVAARSRRENTKFPMASSTHVLLTDYLVLKRYPTRRK